MNKYEILGTVGEGAYGVVLKCRNKINNEIVAIKKFKESEEDESVRKTTIREVKILKMLRHPNIVSLKEAFRRKGKLNLVFEYVEKNLLEVLEERPRGLDVDIVRRFVYQLCKSIDFCHQNGIIHRDIKPENLLINPDHSLRLCDFGFSRTVQQGHSLSNESLTSYVATRWYRAPELLVGTNRYTTAVDLWAIGCIMGELFSGEALFPGDSEIDQLHIIQEIIGPLIPEHLQLFVNNPRFQGYSFPRGVKPETLRKKYHGIAPKMGIRFMHDIMQMNPRKRMTAAECLQHPYFEGLATEYNTSIDNNYPVREEELSRKHKVHFSERKRSGSSSSHSRRSSGSRSAIQDEKRERRRKKEVDFEQTPNSMDVASVKVSTDGTKQISSGRRSKKEKRNKKDISSGNIQKSSSSKKKHQDLPQINSCYTVFDYDNPYKNY